MGDAVRCRCCCCAAAGAAVVAPRGSWVFEVLRPLGDAARYCAPGPPGQATPAVRGGRGALATAWATVSGRGPAAAGTRCCVSAGASAPSWPRTPSPGDASASPSSKRKRTASRKVFLAARAKDHSSACNTSLPKASKLSIRVWLRASARSGSISGTARMQSQPGGSGIRPPGEGLPLRACSANPHMETTSPQRCWPMATTTAFGTKIVGASISGVRPNAKPKSMRKKAPSARSMMLSSWPSRRPST
mmetsp:Transcript_127407/g.396586  ORF Transcript_127407/g.396586 Transcript_127407/m.396586 type:complete len:247 (-) Transcript_127407:149-889(-)